jgi:WD40 repeat protein
MDLNLSLFPACSDDGLVKVWDVKRKENEHTLKGHLSDVKCVSWHPDRALIVSGGKDNTLRLWDPRKQDPVRYQIKCLIICILFVSQSLLQHYPLPQESSDGLRLEL